MATTVGKSILGALTGNAADLASMGVEPSMRGMPVSNGVTPPLSSDSPPNQQPDAQPDMAAPFAGLGPLLEEADDLAVFRAVHDLVIRQERLARNRYNQDLHWTRVRRGVPFSRLEKVQDQDVWRAVLPPGSARLTAAAVPNKADDLCNKIVETLLVDLPKPQAQATNESEEAERSAEMATQFLLQNGGESGTRDALLFWDAMDGAMTSASRFLEAVVEPQGGGWYPKQMQAHPQAVDVSQPYVGPDGATTPDLVLRYVTEDGQFTDDPSQAAKVWYPAIVGLPWKREHIRMYPETADVWTCEKLIVLGYCTVGQAKRRWQAVADMTPTQIQGLLDWTPPRPRVLLPPALRSRWRTETGSETQPGSPDERVMFYYRLYIRSCVEYPEGAVIDVTGAFGGFVLEKGSLSVDVPTPEGMRETRCLDIPVTQFRPVADPDDQDPTGRPVIERFGGASEARATLWTAYLEQTDKILHPNVFVPFNGPEGWQLRARNDEPIVLNGGIDAKPTYETPPPLPGDFHETLMELDKQMDSISGLQETAQGVETSNTVSGVAKSIAVRQSLVSLSRMQQAMMMGVTRWWRLVLEQAQTFAVPQLIKYVGDDGAYKATWFTGADFVHVEDVAVQPGTGTMMPPQTKQQYVMALEQSGYLGKDDAADIMLDTIGSDIGITPNPHKERIERQVSAFLEGPPSPEWVLQWQQYAQQKAVYDQAMVAYQQQAQAYQVALQNTAIVNAGMPAPTLGPESQNSQAAIRYAQAAESLAMNPLGPQPMPPQIPAPQPPPHPFLNVLPNDDEPDIATIRHRRLSKVLSTVRFASLPKEWQQPAIEEYTRMRQASAIGKGAMQAMPQSKGQPPMPTSPEQPPANQPPQLQGAPSLQNQPARMAA